jgi:CubicO group peptidase (beta-lactamase class C family)
MLHCWGDPDYTYNSASVGKAFNGFILQLAIDRGLVTGDERVCDVWPECPSDCGEISTLRKLFHMQGGFETSNGFQDGCNNQVCGGGYSTGGQWRLNQTMTYILGENLKDFLDRELLRHIGIDSTDWYWLSGADVYANTPPPNAAPEQSVLYPRFTESDRWYGCFIDPPYVIGGQTVVGGGGWVGMSPKDLARIGLLLASEGWWDGRQLISDTDLVDGHAGCGDSDLRAVGGDRMFSWGRVATEGVTFPDDSLIVGPIVAQ